MAVNAVVGSPGNRMDVGGISGTDKAAFTFIGSATDTKTLLSGTADETIVIDYIYLQACDGNTWSLNIGDDSTGQVVRIEGDYDADGDGTQAFVGTFISDRFVWVGGGSSTAGENAIKLTADAAGLCHYVICGVRIS